MKTRVEVSLTVAQAQAVLMALSECLDCTDATDQEAIFGGLRTAQRAGEGAAAIRRALQAAQAPAAPAEE